MAISKDDLRNLIKAGYSTQDIMQLAKSDPEQLQFLAGRATSGGLLPKPAFSRNPFTPLPQSSGGIAGMAVRAGSRQPTSTSLGGALKGTALGQLFGQLNGKGIVEKIVNPAISVAKGAIGRSGIGSGKRVAGTPGLGGISGKPDDLSSYDLPTFDYPELTYRDFSDQARQQVSGIYQPRYAAIDQAAANAQGQYNRSDQITSGLYQNLAKNIADISARSAAQYKDQQAQQAANTQQLVENQGQNYSSAQNQEAQLLQQLGQGEAAKQILGDNSAEQAYQQSQSQAQGNAQGAAIAAQGQTAQDYYGRMDNANQTAGVSARQNLIAQLGDVLQGYDRDRMNLRGDEAQAALSLGQQLSDRDFATQQANYGVARDEYSSQADAQRFAYEQAMQRQQQAMQQAEIKRDQANRDRQFEFDQQKYGTDLATALAQQRLEEQKVTGAQQGGGGLEYNSLDPVSKTVAQITNAAGGNTSMAQQYYDLVRNTVAGMSANGADSAALAGNQFNFIQYVRQNAQAKGLDPILAQSAAASYWQNIFGMRQ